MYMHLKENYHELEKGICFCNAPQNKCELRFLLLLEDL